jgi:nicotinate dehydrogenase subunit B
VTVIELPASLVDNPRLDQWVAFPSAGRITVRTGKVEIGQGVLTAMLQIAADELDVATARITLQSGDTDFAPNEGYIPLCDGNPATMPGKCLTGLRKF